MKLEDEEKEFHLKISGYEWPDEANDYLHANWLRVDILVMDRQDEENIGKPDNWEAISPALLTTEARELCSWLRAAGENREESPSINFREPDLRFVLPLKAKEVVNVPDLPEEEIDRVLRVFFAGDLRPVKEDWQYSSEDFFIDLEVSPGQLRDAASQLQEELESFPERLPGSRPEFEAEAE